jgi:hypothetical protein
VGSEPVHAPRTTIPPATAMKARRWLTAVVVHPRESGEMHRLGARPAPGSR